MLLGTLGPSLMGNMLGGNDVIATRQGKGGVVRAGKGVMRQGRVAVVRAYKEVHIAGNDF